MLSKKMLGKTKKELKILQEVEDNIENFDEKQLRKVLSQVITGYKKVLEGIRKGIEKGQIK